MDVLLTQLVDSTFIIFGQIVGVGDLCPNPRKCQLLLIYEGILTTTQTIHELAHAAFQNAHDTRLLDVQT